MKPETIQILLVEDNPGDIRLLKEYLYEASSLGITGTVFEWVMTDRLSQAVKWIETKHIDLVLLDLSLPDSHGLETFERFQQSAQQLPVIVLSGLDDAGVAIQAVRKGAQDYIVKGEVSASLLFRSIHYAIERKRGEEKLRQVNQKLQDMDKQKSDFLSNVSNELRTPIAVMREGISQCLTGAAGELKTKQKELLKDTLANVDKLERLVIDLLDIPKIEAGKAKNETIMPADPGR